MRGKSGQMVRSGAPFLIIVTLLIVLYIIFLPPEDRAALLDGEEVVTSSGQGGSSGSDAGFVGPDGTYVNPSGVSDRAEFVFAGPGRIDSVASSSYEHSIASIRISSSTEARVLSTENPFVVYANVFKEQPYQMRFAVDEPAGVQDAYLSFKTTRQRGILTLSLNGRIIYAEYIQSKNPTPIKLPTELLLRENILDFQVNSPGWQFWVTNEYAIEELEIKGAVTDTSRQRSYNTFTLRADEVNSVEDVELSFVPECNQRDAGKLRGYINSERIFDQIPDCGIKNVHHFDESVLKTGTNTLEFETSKGSYVLDAIDIDTRIDEEANDVTFFFEMDEDLFNFFVESEEVCGEIDGFCPDNCDEDLDKDCCFEEFTNAYWCDVPTQNTDDRCVGHVDASTIFRCTSGYEDDNGDVPDDFEGICGDDDDNECPLGCSRFYDKDCCLEDDSGRFWCDDMPRTGIIDICKEELPSDSCRLCPDGYDGEDSNPSCSFDSSNPTRDEVELKNDYKVVAEFFFVDDSTNKEAQVIVNGYTTNFDTFKDSTTRDISRFVKDGSNYIRIRPESDFSLVEVRVDIDER